MASDSIKPCGHHPDSGCTCRPPDPPEVGWGSGRRSVEAVVGPDLGGGPDFDVLDSAFDGRKFRIGTGGSFADAIVPADLAVRAEALAAKVSHTVSTVYGAGSYPQAETISLTAFEELVELVRDLAKAVAKR